MFEHHPLIVVYKFRLIFWSLLILSGCDTAVVKLSGAVTIAIEVGTAANKVAEVSAAAATDVGAAETAAIVAKVPVAMSPVPIGIGTVPLIAAIEVETGATAMVLSVVPAAIAADAAALPDEFMPITAGKGATLAIMNELAGHAQLQAQAFPPLAPAIAFGIVPTAVEPGLAAGTAGDAPAATTAVEVPCTIAAEMMDAAADT
jgi:hypothetical protein